MLYSFETVFHFEKRFPTSSMRKTTVALVLPIKTTFWSSATTAHHRSNDFDQLGSLCFLRQCLMGQQTSMEWFHHSFLHESGAVFVLSCPHQNMFKLKTIWNWRNCIRHFYFRWWKMFIIKLGFATEKNDNLYKLTFLYSILFSLSFIVKHKNSLKNYCF